MVSKIFLYIVLIGSSLTNISNSADEEKYGPLVTTFDDIRMSHIKSVEEILPDELTLDTDPLKIKGFDPCIDNSKLAEKIFKALIYTYPYEERQKYPQGVIDKTYIAIMIIALDGNIFAADQIIFNLLKYKPSEKLFKEYFEKLEGSKLEQKFRLEPLKRMSEESSKYPPEYYGYDFYINALTEAFNSPKEIEIPARALFQDLAKRTFPDFYKDRESSTDD